jgi:hypothetical protein
MKKLIVVVAPIVVIAAVGWYLWHKTGADNDSPIIITDASTGILKDPAGQKAQNPLTMIRRGYVANGNTLFAPTARPNTYAVHDKESTAGHPDTYRAACFTFPGGSPVPIPANTASWQLTFSAGAGKLTVNWNRNGVPGHSGPGDIAIEAPILYFSNNELSYGSEITSWTWQIDNTTSPAIQAARGELATIHYCPGGVCSYSGSNPCR